MKLVYIICSLLTFISCNIDSENEIAIYNNYFFNKKSFEVNKEIDFKIKEEYNQRFSLPIQQKKGQIPIFKYLEGQEYKIFIGIPFQLSFEDITNQLLSKKKEPINISKNDNFFSINYKENSQWVTESVIKLGDSSTIYLSTLQDSSNYVNNKNLFTSDSIQKRFYKK